MLIDAVRLPIDVERGVRGGPLFNTIVLRSDGGNTSTNQNWQYPLYQGNVGYGIQSRQNLKSVIDFFWARRGRLRGFLFRDWSDYQFEDVQLGLGDGSDTTFAVKKIYEDDIVPFERPLKYAIESSMTVKVDGVTVADNQWSLSNGIITFNSAPALNAVITASGEFDIPVMFMRDQLEVSMEVWNAGSIANIPISEVRES